MMKNYIDQFNTFKHKYNKKVKFLLLVFPLRTPFWVLFLIELYLIYYYNTEKLEPTTYNINTLYYLALAIPSFIFGLLGIVLISYIFYRFTTREYIKKGDATYLASPNAIQTGNSGEFYVGLPSKTRSNFTSVKLCVQFNHKKFTNLYTLHTKSKEELQLGNYSNMVPPYLLGTKVVLKNLDMGRYKITKSFIFFEDFAGLFRFYYAEEEKGPTIYIYNEEIVKKKKLKYNMEVSILEKRLQDKSKMEGDLFNFKKYTPGSDSLRHILWKKYASKQELICKKPEIENPNSSRLPMFTNFYCSDIYPFTELSNFLLKEFKNRITQTILWLKREDIIIDYFPEDFLEILENQGENSSEFQSLMREYDLIEADKRLEVIVSLQDWQSMYPLENQISIFYDYLKKYNNLKSSLLLFTNSLDTSWLDYYLNQKGQNNKQAVVYYWKVSKVFFSISEKNAWINNLLFIETRKRDWMYNKPSSRIKYTAYLKQIGKNEDYIETNYKQANIYLIEL